MAHDKKNGEVYVKEAGEEEKMENEEKKKKNIKKMKKTE